MAVQLSSLLETARNYLRIEWLLVQPVSVAEEISCSRSKRLATPIDDECQPTAAASTSFLWLQVAGEGLPSKSPFLPRVHLYFYQLRLTFLSVCLFTQFFLGRSRSRCRCNSLSFLILSGRLRMVPTTLWVVADTENRNRQGRENPEKRREILAKAPKKRAPSVVPDGEKERKEKGTFADRQTEATSTPLSSDGRVTCSLASAPARIAPKKREILWVGSRLTYFLASSLPVPVLNLTWVLAAIQRRHCNTHFAPDTRGTLRN